MHRALILCTATAFICAPALADDSEAASTDAVYACAELADDLARLACYDTAVGRLKAAEEAGEVTTITKTEIEEVQRDAFGFSLPSLPKLTMPSFGRSDNDEASDRTGDDGTLKSVVLAVREVTVSKHKGLTITLENDQIWQQNESKSVYYSPKRGAQEAEIKRGALGGYRMKLDGGTAFRVKRLK